MENELESITLKAFQEAYAAYKYPFASSDKLLEAKDSGYRAMYYEKAAALCTDEVLQQEIEEMRRTIYAHLALQSMTDVERTSYRATLIALVGFTKRLQALGERVKTLPMKRIVDSL